MTNIILNLYGLIMNTIYPTYSSFCAIQTKDSSDDKQWLTYWINYIWNLIISFLDFTFFGYLSKLFKSFNFNLVSSSKLKGAETVFNCVIKRFL